MNKINKIISELFNENTENFVLIDVLKKIDEVNEFNKNESLVLPLEFFEYLRETVDEDIKTISEIIKYNKIVYDRFKNTYDKNQSAKFSYNKTNKTINVHGLKTYLLIQKWIPKNISKSPSLYIIEIKTPVNTNTPAYIVTSEKDILKKLISKQ